MKTFIIICCSFIGFLGRGFCQQFSGELVYKETFDWANAYRSLPFFKGSDLERKIIRDSKEVRYFKLLSDSTASFYYGFTEGSKVGEVLEKNFFSVNKTDSTVVQRGQLYKRLFEVRGKDTPYKWKILDSVKEIAGYMCLKAQTKDEKRGHIVEAWFTSAIPSGDGPEDYRGLPGLVLEVNINNGAKVIEMISIKANKISKPVISREKIKIAYTPEEYAQHVRSIVQGHIQKNEYPFIDLSY